MTLFLSLAMLVSAAVQVQAPPTYDAARKLFEAGKYGEVVQMASASEAGEMQEPRAQYLVAQSQQRMGNAGAARQVYEGFKSRDEGDAWHHIGVSGLNLVSPPPPPPGGASPQQAALAAASRAVEISPDLPEAQFQLGLAASNANDFARAAQAFDQAGTLDPANAYAQYYAGLSYYKAKRVDQMAIRFERFLKLAPNAPERGEVESIMRTIRKR